MKLEFWGTDNRRQFWRINWHLTKSENDATEPDSEDKEEAIVTDSVEDSKSPENQQVENVVTSSNNDKSKDEPPVKKSKVAEKALTKIEAEKLLKEKEKQDAES